MEIKSTQAVTTKTSESKNVKQNSTNSQKFSDELKSLSKEKETNDSKEVDSKDDSKSVDSAIDGLEDAVNEISQLNRTDENSDENVKNKINSDDNKNKRGELGLIDNNFNIQDKDKINLQMGAEMSFNSNGQPFAEFINNEQNKNSLGQNVKDIAEEQAILSTMEENIAMANKNMALNKSKTTSSNQNIKNDINDNAIKYDSVIMDKADVEFFAKLVENGQLNLREIQNASKSSAVSKTLADLLAKSMNDNKPIRIDFDNNISVIIKISRDGKISADFLPSSQVAEAYLKENLPLLRQRFDDNNIDYDELNQRRQKQDNEDNRKKGRKDE